MFFKKEDISSEGKISRRYFHAKVFSHGRKRLHWQPSTKDLRETSEGPS